MKKILVLSAAIMFCFATSNSYAGDIFIGKKGGGPNGYNSVKETHGGGVSSLDCQDPGYCSCTWTVQPSLIVPSTGNPYTSDQIEAMVEQQISNNIVQGSFNLDNDPTVIVSWGGTDVDNYSMQVQYNSNN
jgi:hypothetical protein